MDEFICTICQTTQPQGDGFCRECGGKLQSVIYCEVCGVPLNPGVAFCRECGAPAPKAKPKTAAAPPAKPQAPPPRPAPVAPRREPQGAGVSLAPSRAAPVARAGSGRAAPIQISSPAVAPSDPPPVSVGQTLSSVAVGGLGVAMLATGGTAALGGVVALPLALALSWKPVQYYGATLVGEMVDWVWPRRGLRRRFLGE